MADDIEDDFSGYSFGGEYGSEAASVEFQETGKRSRNSDDSFEVDETNSKKKRKKNRSNKISKFIKDRDESQAIRTAPACDQVDFLRKMCCSSITESNVIVFDGDHETENIQSLIESASKQNNLQVGEEDETGSPSILIISSSAVGCLPFISGLKKSKWRVIKLFAKHIKIAQQVEQLQRNVSIGIGTPNRILQLLSQGSLKLSGCKLLIIDLSENVKRQTLLDVNETKSDVQALFQVHFQQRFEAKDMQIALF